MPRYERKCWFANFGTSFTAFAVLFLELWRLFLLDWRYCCQNTGENVHSLFLKPVLRHLLLNFYQFGGYFCRSKVPLLRYMLKSLFASFEPGFNAFAILFLALWRLFLGDWRYRCQDTGKKVHSPSLKLVLQH